MLLRLVFCCVLMLGCVDAFAADGSFGNGTTSGGGASGSWGDGPAAQPSKVTARGTVLVLDESGQDYEAATGASVKVRDKSSVGTLTDIDGKFKLDVDKETDVLHIHLLGQKDAEISASQCKENCVIKLEVDSRTLSGVTVTAPALVKTPEAQPTQVKTPETQPTQVKKPEAQPARVAVSGTVMVLDDMGKDYEGAIGATVQMRDNPSVGVMTGADGKFNLTVDKDSDMLRISYVGYQDASVPASRCVKGCEIKLEPAENMLGNVDALGCSVDMKARLQELWEKCAPTDSKLAEAVSVLQKNCDNLSRLENWEAIYAGIKDIDPNKCGKIDTVPVLRERVGTIVKSIDGLRSGLNVSKWKDKEGNFNTARLLSDSVAGVVLGTAGGLITSNIVKKNQIKGGFEDIHCVVQGQVVADYGDEFVVGVR